MIAHEHGLIEHKQTPLQGLLPNFISQPCSFFLHSCEINLGEGLGTRLYMEYITCGMLYSVDPRTRDRGPGDPDMN